MANPVTPVIPPPPPGAAGGLGEKVEATVERVLAWMVNIAGEGISGIIRAALELFFEVIAGILAPYAVHLYDEIDSNPAVPDYIKNSIPRPSATTSASDGMVAFVFVITSLVGGWLGISGPSRRLAEYAVDEVLGSARPDPDLAWRIAWRSGDATEMQAFMDDLGWSRGLQNAMRDVIRPRPGPADLFRSSFREHITIGEANIALQQQGWAQADIDLLEELAKQLPGPGDLITMAVRGAFSPEEIQEFDLGAEFPVAFAEWMTKQGFDEEWAQRYWYAHWNLPSITAGYEMLHRRVVDEPTLDLLLKAQDISPFWRDKLKAISYNPLTRVDVRRMYGMGVLDEVAVYNSYLDIGYTPENADLMTQFTVMYETDEPRSLTKADILRGVKEGMLTSGEATSWLVDAGYPESLAEFYVAREQAAVARDFATRRARVIGEQFVHHELTEPQARTQLTSLGFASSEIDLRIDDWLIDRQAKIKRPTQAQVARFFRDDIISQAEYEQMLSNLGYPSNYADWYLQSTLAQKAEDVLKAEQEALSEAEALRLATVKTGYQVGKAELDVRIAELRTAVTDLQLALQARTRRYRSERRVAAEIPTVAQIREQADTDVAALQDQLNAQSEAAVFLEQQIEQRESVIAEFELQLVEQRADIAPDVEGRQGHIDALRSAVRGHQLAVERLQISIAEADASIGELTAEVEPLRQSIAQLELEIREAREVIDRLQTDIADRRLAIAQIKEALAVTLAGGVSEEQEAELKEAASLDTLALQTDIRELEVNVESVEDTIAVRLQTIREQQEQARLLREAVAIDVSVFESAVAGYRVEIEQEQAAIADANEQVTALQGEIREIEAPVRRVSTSVQESRLVIERAQDDIAVAAVEMARLRRAMAQRREQERQTLAIAERVVTVAEIDNAYDADREGIETQLAQRRADLNALIEQKAQLQLDYRSDLLVEV